MTEELHFPFSLSCIGEGNGNPLQCSYLENPRDGGGLVGCRLWGRTESDTIEATLQQQQQQQCSVLITEMSMLEVFRKWQLFLLVSILLAITSSSFDCIKHISRSTQDTGV